MVATVVRAPENEHKRLIHYGSEIASNGVRLKAGTSRPSRRARSRLRYETTRRSAHLDGLPPPILSAHSCYLAYLVRYCCPDLLIERAFVERMHASPFPPRQSQPGAGPIVILPSMRSQ
jgi:hypothetical protein